MSFSPPTKRRTRDPQFNEFSDWIELYNNAREAKDVSGYHVTDDLDEPMKWRIPDGTVIAGGGFLASVGRRPRYGTSYELQAEQRRRAARPVHAGRVSRRYADLRGAAGRHIVRASGRRSEPMEFLQATQSRGRQ